jgi:hypothetical protein
MSTLGVPMPPAMPPATTTPETSTTTSPLGGIERRRSSREPVITPGTLRAIANEGLADTLDPGQQVLVTNVSLHGAGFRCHHRLPLDTLYAIEIGIGPLHLTSRIRIVRVRRLQDGTYDIGGEFC